jgi:hypothetical protein
VGWKTASVPRFVRVWSDDVGLLRCWAVCCFATSQSPIKHEDSCFCFSFVSRTEKGRPILLQAGQLLFITPAFL